MKLGPKAQATVDAWVAAGQKEIKDEDFLGIGRLEGGPVRLWYNAPVGVLSANLNGDDWTRHLLSLSEEEALNRTLWQASDIE